MSWKAYYSLSVCWTDDAVTAEFVGHFQVCGIGFVVTAGFVCTKAYVAV